MALFPWEHSLVWQQEAAGEPVPLLAHTDIDWPPLWHRVDAGVRANPVQLWVQVQGPMVACGRQKVVIKVKVRGVFN